MEMVECSFKMEIFMMDNGNKEPLMDKVILNG
jgi:hypothetical protein